MAGSVSRGCIDDTRSRDKRQGRDGDAIWLRSGANACHEKRTFGRGGGDSTGLAPFFEQQIDDSVGKGAPEGR